MDIASFFTDLLIKPESDLSKFLNKLTHIVLLYLLSFSIWTLLGGTVKIPKEFSVTLIWDFVFSGQILIPVILVFITSKLIYFMKNIFFPLVILFLYSSISRLVKKLYKFFYKNTNNPIKQLIILLTDIYFLSVSSNKLKRGKFFTVYKVYAKKINIAEVSKEHIIALDLVCKILIIWICLIGFEDFSPYYFYKFVKYGLAFLVIYIPLNLSFLYFINDYKKPISEIIDVIERSEKSK